MPMGSLAPRLPVLIILHQEHSTPGRVGAGLKAMGARLDIRRPSHPKYILTEPSSGYRFASSARASG